MQYTVYLSKERMYCKFLNVEMASWGKRLRNCLLWRSIKPRLVIIHIWYDFSVVLLQNEKSQNDFLRPFLIFPTKGQVYIHARQNGGNMAGLVILLSFPDSMPSSLAGVMSRLSSNTTSTWITGSAGHFPTNREGTQLWSPFVPNQRNTIWVNLLSKLMAVLPMFQNYKSEPNWHERMEHS